MSWLDCKTHTCARKKVVTKLLCTVCKRFKEKIEHKRNFSERWIVRADSLRTSNIHAHSRADQHVNVMMLLKEHAKSSGASCSYSSPIAQTLSKLPDLEKSELCVKFDVAYFVAREKMAFSKYPKLCELEARHGVSVGTSYANEIAGKTFTQYIAKAKLQELAEKLEHVSSLMDGRTDSSDSENEIFMVVSCDAKSSDEMVHTKTDFLCVVIPSTTTASGLLECVNVALCKLCEEEEEGEGDQAASRRADRGGQWG